MAKDNSHVVHAVVGVSAFANWNVTNIQTEGKAHIDPTEETIRRLIRFFAAAHGML